MTGFDASWLELRADADARACAPSWERLLPRAGPFDADARIVDLGAGSGNNALRVAPVLARCGVRSQRWTLVDDDPVLLARAVERLGALDERIEVETVVQDLAGGVDRALLGGTRLLTCSALLDLASVEWIEALAEAARSAEVPAIFSSLDIDGTVEWSPTDPFDPRARAAFDADMRRDKGLGVAVAGDVKEALLATLHPLGYRLLALPTPWELDDRDAALQRRYLDDVAGVVARTELPEEVAAWRVRRQAWIDDGTSRLVVGHYDALAVLDSLESEDVADVLGALRSRSNSTSSPIR